ncbi:type II secretion system F family protein [Ghiorsea bivora]|uniref:type II secretion system F family protein n=1 Tax=Ghiorsea bivora TaxID=1485545 RepID=UPI000570C41E|nr:type II secretion system F family protein [Ghiorsea bivora]
MAIFAYDALDAQGKRKKGQIDAESERAARKLLRTQGLMVRKLVSVEQVQKQTANGKTAAKLKPAETVNFLQQLSTLIDSGMPLVEALSSIAEGMENARSMQVVSSVRQQVVEGSSLADALRIHNFDDVICNMVEAGEETGQLDAVATRLAELLERRQALSQELLSATLYPVIILAFGVVVMLFLLAVVVPQIVTVFERAGGDLPALTVFVIATSEFIRNNGLVLILLFSASVFTYIMAMKKEVMRYKRDKLLLKIPALSSLLLKTNTSRYTRTLGMLLEGGVPALAAMKIAQQSITLLPMREAVSQARDMLREGSSLADGLKTGGFVPLLALRMIAVGEQSGTLDRMLIRVADNYDKESSRNIKRLLTIMEPMLVMGMAVGVGTLAMAILLPIVEMNQLVH